MSFRPEAIFFSAIRSLLRHGRQLFTFVKGTGHDAAITGPWTRTVRIRMLQTGITPMHLSILLKAWNQSVAGGLRTSARTDGRHSEWSELDSSSVDRSCRQAPGGAVRRRCRLSRVFLSRSFGLSLHRGKIYDEQPLHGGRGRVAPEHRFFAPWQRAREAQTSPDRSAGIHVADVRIPYGTRAINPGSSP